MPIRTGTLEMGTPRQRLSPRILFLSTAPRFTLAAYFLRLVTLTQLPFASLSIARLREDLHPGLPPAMRT